MSSHKSTCKSAIENWHTLKVTHEDTSTDKESKILVFVYKFELFQMEENETITEMITGFTNSTNCHNVHRKDYTWWI